MNGIRRVFFGMLAAMLAAMALAGCTSQQATPPGGALHSSAATSSVKPTASLDARAAQETAAILQATLIPTVQAGAIPTRPPGCTVVSKQPTPQPISADIIPPVSSDDWVIGDEKALVTIIEYGDFQ